MKILCKKQWLLWIVVFCNTPVHSMNEDPLVRLQLNAELPGEIIPGIPVEVQLSVKNIGPDKLTLLQFPPSGNMIRVNIKDDGGALIYDGVAVKSLFSGVTELPPIELSPGKRESFNLTLTVAWEGIGVRKKDQPLFLSEGEFEMSFTTLIPWMEGDEKRKQKWFRSKPIMTHVLNPRESDLGDAWEAFNDLSNPEAFLVPDYFFQSYLIYSDELHLAEKAADEAKEFIRNHGESPWAAQAWHVRALMAMSYHKSPGLQLEYAERAIELAETYQILPTIELNKFLRESALRSLPEAEEMQD